MENNPDQDQQSFSTPTEDERMREDFMYDELDLSNPDYMARENAEILLDIATRDATVQ